MIMKPLALRDRFSWVMIAVLVPPTALSAAHGTETTIMTHPVHRSAPLLPLFGRLITMMDDIATDGNQVGVIRRDGPGRSRARRASDQDR